MGILHLVNDAIESALRASRRLDRYYRDAFDATLRGPLVSIVQLAVRLTRRHPVLEIAGERRLPDEDEIARRIAERMKTFLVKHYSGKVALRAGNTKTHGLVRGILTVEEGLPAELCQGLFREPRSYRAWVRFGGPGPLAPPDLDDNGILSLSVKVMGVEGEKLLPLDERWTQDFTGISAPTFTTPDVVENLELQRQIGRGTPALYFLSPRHWLDAVLQGLYSRAHGNPLEVQYFSCVPYLHGPGQAARYSFRPAGAGRTPIPRRPGPNYLREAMAATLAAGEARFDLLVQLQTDPRRMPVEDASVIWPERLSPYRKVATLRLPPQRFDSPEQVGFDRHLSFNPWHALPDHRPLGNQNRARRHIYLELSRARQRMNGDRRVEPTGDEEFPGSPPLVLPGDPIPPARDR